MNASCYIVIRTVALTGARAQAHTRARARNAKPGVPLGVYEVTRVADGALTLTALSGETYAVAEADVRRLAADPDILEVTGDLP
jgi:hypothetical protein